MSLIYIVRHGETDWNREGRYQGRLESALTELGRQQAEALADALADSSIRRVISSPLQRTADTARTLAKRLGIPLELDERLIEVAHGAWEGRLRVDIERDDPDRMRIWRTQPEQVQFQGGENLEAVAGRWRSLAADLGDTKSDVALVTHDAVVRAALLDLCGRPLTEFWQPRVLNGGYARCLIMAGASYLLDECCHDHLAGIMSDRQLQAL